MDKSIVEHAEEYINCMKATDDTSEHFQLISGLLAEVEEKDKALKLVRYHAKTAVDNLPIEWNEGYQSGMKAAGYEWENVHEAFKQLRKERSDDNANFTEEVMRLEAENAARKEEVKKLRNNNQWYANYANDKDRNVTKWMGEANKLEAENAALKEALSRIALIMTCCDYNEPAYVVSVCGIAKEALAGK